MLFEFKGSCVKTGEGFRVCISSFHVTPLLKQRNCKFLRKMRGRNYWREKVNTVSST